ARDALVCVVAGLRQMRPEGGKARTERALAVQEHTCKRDPPAADSTPMQSRITQTGTAWAWLSFVVALALTIPLIWRAWTIIGPNTYTGGDGKSWQTLIRAVIQLAPALYVKIFNPLPGQAVVCSPVH